MRKTYWMAIGLGLLLAGCGGGGGAPLPPDNTPPTISNLAVERVGNQVQLSVVVQDAQTGVASVVVLATVGSSTQSVQAAAAGNNRYQASLPANTVRVRVRAQDRAGNTRESTDVPAPPPLPPF